MRATRWKDKKREGKYNERTNLESKGKAMTSKCNGEDKESKTNGRGMKGKENKIERKAKKT